MHGRVVLQPCLVSGGGGRESAANAMRETNESALVLKALSPLEKAEPGARRILAGMVADVLAMAKENSSLNTPQRLLRVDAQFTSWIIWS